MMRTKAARLLEVVQKKHVIRPRDIEKIGIPRNYLTRLVNQGKLRKVERGLYTTDSAPTSEHMSLVEVSHKVPKAVFCLLSPLRFHEIGTQIPSEVWIALDGKAWTPRINYPPVRIMRFSGAALQFGVQEHRIKSSIIRVYSPAKTVADCFKFRYRIGLDVALEALRDCYTERRATMDELHEAARVCRVAKVIRPYLESVV